MRIDMDNGIVFIYYATMILVPLGVLYLALFVSVIFIEHILKLIEMVKKW